jgi:hypothetical protein
MTWLSTLFQQGGPTVMWILMLVLPSVAVVGLHIGLRRRWSLWLSLGTIAVILGIGLFGMMSGRHRVEAFVADVASEEERAEHLERGYQEANRPVQVAGVVGGILFVGVIIGELRRRSLARSLASTT